MPQKCRTRAVSHLRGRCLSGSGRSWRRRSISTGAETSFLCSSRQQHVLISCSPAVRAGTRTIVRPFISVLADEPHIQSVAPLLAGLLDHRISSATPHLSRYHTTEPLPSFTVKMDNNSIPQSNISGSQSTNGDGTSQTPPAPAAIASGRSRPVISYSRPLRRSNSTITQVGSDSNEERIERLEVRDKQLTRELGEERRLVQVLEVQLREAGSRRA